MAVSDMPLVCEDLAQYGVILVPPSTAEYIELHQDIEHRLRTRPAGSPPLADGELSQISEHDGKSAVLVNRAPVAIAAMAYIWLFPGLNGQVFPARHTPGTNASTLLPFNLDERGKRFDTYWNTIFPGSKRLMRAERSTLGDNSDVRPPLADELWQGGFVTGSGGDPWLGEPTKLTLDGIFFVDGGFAGPNLLGSWEEVVFAAEAYLACSALARKYTRPANFFREVQKFTGLANVDRRAVARSFVPGPKDLEPIRKNELQKVGRIVLSLRQIVGDEAAVTAIAAWADRPVPKFCKL